MYSKEAVSCRIFTAYPSKQNYVRLTFSNRMVFTLTGGYIKRNSAISDKKEFLIGIESRIVYQCMYLPNAGLPRDKKLYIMIIPHLQRKLTMWKAVAFLGVFF